ncbi:MAG: hypothetical protein KKE62_20010 [Proteobacteria bacterium]|nr:hypothetical protein [Pseudomonadota bacterium]
MVNDTFDYQVEVHDSDGYGIASYAISGQPSGIIINSLGKFHGGSALGTIQGYTVTVTVTNDNVSANTAETKFIFGFVRISQQGILTLYNIMAVRDKTKKYILIYSGLFAAFCLLFIFTGTIGIAEQSSPDAIAIRVMPNPNYFSPGRWYKDQGFTGSPQSLTVDGYEAVRDGRTVYVNAANMKDDKIFTNIYIISYNQNPEPATVDIFGKILKHWKFNSNITATGECSISSIICHDDGSCADNYECVDNKCVLDDENKVNCFIDADCPSGSFCNSLKAKIIRDVKRLSEFVGVNETIEKYRWVNGHYPKLSAGTYLPNKTVSTWPSWDETLGAELGTTLPRDLINRLGKCKNDDEENKKFHPVTCWDNLKKEFAGTIISDNQPEISDQLKLPAASSAYIYTVKPDGSAYSICGVMESGYWTTLEHGACEGSANTPQYHGVTDNHAPIITCGALQGLENSEFIGYISAYDRDDDELQWTLDSSINWLTDSNLYGTDVKNYKKIQTQAGATGSYEFDIKVEDNKGGVGTTTCAIQINEANSPMILTIPDQSTSCSLDFIINARDPNEQYPLSFDFTDSPLSCFEIIDGSQCHIKQGTTGLSTGNFNVKAININGKESNLTSFNLNILPNNPPQITILNNNNYITYTAGDTLNVDILSAEDTDYPLTYELSPELLDGFIETFQKNADNKFVYNISGKLANTVSLPDGTTNFDFTINITDSCDRTSNSNLAIIAENTAPSFSFTVDNQLEAIDFGTNRTATKQITATDTENNEISYSIASPVSSFSINSEGLISMPIDDTMGGIYNITVTATDEYGAASSESFVLTVTVKELPPAFISASCSGKAKHNPSNGDQINEFTCNVSINSDNAIASPITYSLVDQSGCTGCAADSNLEINKINNSDYEALISGFPPNLTQTYKMLIKATDSNLESNTQNFDLTVATYCGDGTIQMPSGYESPGIVEECEVDTFINSDDPVPAGVGFNFNGEDCVSQGYDLISGTSLGCVDDTNKLTCKISQGTCDYFTTWNLSGNVKDGLTGNNVSGAKVSAQGDHNGDPNFEYKSATTDENGDFMLSVPGYLNGDITSNGGVPYKVDHIAITASDKTGGVNDLFLIPGYNDHNNILESQQFFIMPNNWADPWAGVGAIITRWDGIRELDSHLQWNPGPSHLYYRSTPLNGSKVSLSTGCTDGVTTNIKQEAIIIGSPTIGSTYGYFIDNFLNNGAPLPDECIGATLDFNSNVIVQVLDENAKLIKQFRASDHSERYWNIFTMIPSDNPIIIMPVDPANAYTDSQPNAP